MAGRDRSVARVYAAALAEIGRETKSLGTIHDDLAKVVALHEGDAWFRTFFTSPRIDRRAKWKAVERAFHGKVGKPVAGLLKVLIEKGRESVLAGVAAEYDKLRDEAENRIHAHVVVAKALPEESKKGVAQKIEAACGKSVVLHERVDPAVLGGASIRIGDRVMDRTLRTRLAAMKKQFLQS